MDSPKSISFSSALGEVFVNIMFPSLRMKGAVSPNLRSRWAMFL